MISLHAFKVKKSNHIPVIIVMNSNNCLNNNCQFNY